MSIKLQRVLVGVAIGSTASFVLVGCGDTTEPASTDSAPYSKTVEEACIAGAEEGEFNYWSASDPEQFAAEVKPFEAAYPDIKVNFTSLRPDEVTQRIVTEAQTGHAVGADATTTDLPSAVPLFDQGLIAEVDYAKLGIADNLISEVDGISTFRVFRDPLGLAYNPDITSKSELPKTWDELADSKWDGKVMVDPRGVYLAGISSVWGEEKTIDWFDRLMDNANPVILRGATASLQKVATGEIALSTSATTSAVREQQAAGAPVALVYLDVVAAEDKSGVIIKDAQHPNAAACFMAWWGSEEGQAMQLEVEYKSNEDVPADLPAGSTLSVSTSAETHETEVRVAQYISGVVG